jgi:hypothetical protein
VRQKEDAVEHVMFVINSTPEADTPDGPEREALQGWLDEVEPVRRYGARLRPPADSTVVRVRGGELVVTSGPFAEADEWIGGFDVLDVAGIDRAVELAGRHPGADGGRVEVRAAWPFEPEV